MNELTELAVVLGLAAGFGIIAKILRQPLMLAYLVTGMLLGLLRLTPIAADPLYRLFSDLGVMLLLFLIGLDINVTSLRLVGATSAILGLGQIVATFAGGFVLAVFFGLDLLPAAYLGLTLAFSSTIIVVKLLSEKNELSSLHGKLTVGLLLVQDFVAILLLVVLVGLEQGTAFSAGAVLLTILKGVMLFGAVVWLSRAVMPTVFDLIARSPELLFITSLAWMFLLAVIVRSLGFSIEIGGFLAGLALANASEHFQISGRIKPLRDFFLILFFVTLGTSMSVSTFAGLVWPIIILSLFVLIGKPLIVLAIMGSMGYHRRTSFMTGAAIGQVSEFSLIIIALGLRLGHIPPSVATVVTAAAVVTILVSSYLTIHADGVYRRLDRWLRLFERPHRREDRADHDVISRPIILIGGHRLGQSLLTRLSARQVAVIDFDPDIVSHLRRQGYTCLYGDVADPDVLSRFDLRRLRTVISTSPGFADNLQLLTEWRRLLPDRRRVRFIVRAETQADADRLYAAGATYVVVPQITSGQVLGHLLARPLAFRRLSSAGRSTPQWRLP